MAFTVEHEGSETEITVMDPTGDDLDVKILFTENGVYITQFNVNTNQNDLIMMTASMFSEMVESYDSTEGFHNGTFSTTNSD